MRSRVDNGGRILDKFHGVAISFGFTSTLKQFYLFKTGMHRNDITVSNGYECVCAQGWITVFDY